MEETTLKRDIYGYPLFEDDPSEDDWGECQDPATTFELKTYESLGASVGRLVEEKQRQYGDSVGKTGSLLETLYPNGIFPDQYKHALLIIRMMDKICRIANRDPGEKDKGGESPFRDLAGYSLLGLLSDDNES